MTVKAEKAVKTEAESTKRKASADADIEIDLSAPEPPSKRARRAVKKGRTIGKKAAGDNSGAEEDGSDDGGNGKGNKARSEHGIWVGNLPFTVTAAELRQWLVDNSGEGITSESITRIKLPTTRQGKSTAGQTRMNKGFAYIDFSDVASKLAAMTLSETELGGRRLLIKDAASFEGRPPPREAEPTVEAEEEEEEAGSRKIFVGNMSFNTTEDDMTRHFAKCGEIEFVKIATFEDSGKCKGFGWVRFREARAAASAVKGFVKIKEQVETHRDFGEDDDGDEEEKPQIRTRKWWVNKLLGRQLRVELAEDDQLRYRKRFGKDAVKREATDKVKDMVKKDKKRDEAGEPRKESVAMREASDIRVARLKGSLVKHTGTKVVFD
ncbi:hypothetical protein XA68_14012 [Ophiocordyceps unilateralis]|uniref:RRM domain-containing protein n=1 Tax=Ophiocordyceps unilateralis TaxID=268505 RepID=A0A2A9PBE1_OPHUN|nr:hypothetical protein XA68_14012 [Ophiocordyceps unilateralis]